MKSPFGLRPTASIVAVLLFGRAAILGGPAGPVYIPPPVPAADQALTIAMEHIKAREKVDAAIISLQWNTPSHFQPHFGDGIQWIFTEAPQEWSWFVTYSLPADKSRLETAERQKKVNIRVLRIRPDGKVEESIGVKT